MVVLTDTSMPGCWINFVGRQELKITYKDKATTITRAPVYPDTLRAWFFENLENLNPMYSIL